MSGEDLQKLPSLGNGGPSRAVGKTTGDDRQRSFSKASYR